ncbi:MAG: TonB-dependent receptor [Candidatus Omnitrophota bacterium]|nr:TonB-dependent receptor [Candidatus Omnitrophota bacterium]
MKSDFFAAKVCIGATLFFLVCGSAFAEDAAAREYDLGNVIVSATKTQTYQGEVGSSTTVISADDIKKTGKRNVLEVLRDVPGVIVSQSGAFGGTTSVYLRGAKSEQTLVMIDGVEVNDPIGSGGSRTFNFAHLVTDSIERIEIVRGPQSPLYGSDAMAGVINIITKRGKGKPGAGGYFEGGSHNTFRENLASSGAIDKFNYSLSITRLDSNGINKVTVGDENDPYHNTAISSKFGYKIFDNAELSLVANYTDTVTSTDYGARQDVSNYTGRSKDLVTKFVFDQAINSVWSHTLSFSYHDMRTKDKKEWDAVNLDTVNDWYKGNNKKVEWQHNISPVKWNVLTAGFEYEDESGSSKQDRKSIYDYACYFQDQFKFWEKLFTTPGVRVDSHELFGGKTTYKISTAYFIAQTATRLKGNWGTGFKAPTLYQLYSQEDYGGGPIGDPGLKPEESTGYDLGFEQYLFNDKLSFDLTYFHNDFRNMIDYDMGLSKFLNIGRARTKGFEVGLKVSPIETLALGANFTYTDTENKKTGLQLLRRPKRQFNFDANWAFLPNANLNLGINHVGSRKDSGYITDKSYTIARLASSYDITENFQVFGRIENLFDKEYQEVDGYATTGRSFYGGIKAKF